MTPNFAVIIPLHNKGREIGATLNSVLAQTYPPVEILVVDDASTDDGPAIVAACRDSRLRLLCRAEPCSGGYAARNLAIAESTAEWIAFLDADDVWHVDHLAALAALVQAYPQAGCVATRYTHVFRNRREPDCTAGPFAGAEASIIDFAGFLRGWLAAGHCPLWTGALAIRRDVLARSGIFPDGQALRGGDKDLWLRVMRETTLAFLPQSTVDFHREAADKLTDRVGTRELPCLVPTARALSRMASPSERRLLRRLINQEIMLYARWTTHGTGKPRFGIVDMAWPPGPSALATVLVARHLPHAWLQRARRLWQRRHCAVGRQ